MIDSPAQAAFNAINEIFILYGVPELPEGHYLHAHLTFWITKHERCKSVKPVGRPPSNKPRKAHLEHARVVYDAHEDGFYFFYTKYDAWEIVGFSESGLLYAATVERARNSVEIIDPRSRLRPNVNPEVILGLANHSNRSYSPEICKRWRKDNGLLTASELLERNRQW